jgi:hypothetical protein
MTMNPLPPQAYTKDTLMRAYAWLQTQSEPIRELATSTDMLVSLYLKAQREGEESLARPAILNFRNELKNLAGLMGPQDFATSAHAQAHENMSAEQVQAAAAVVASTPTPPLIALAPVITSSPTAGTVFGPTLVKATTVEGAANAVTATVPPTPAATTIPTTMTATTASIAQNTAPAASQNQALPQVEPQQVVQQTRLDSPVPSVEKSKSSALQDLDEKSLNIIREVTQGLNLSCETEALRLLISLGFSKAKTLIENTK